ncbi:hypothetical protein RINTHH_5150 [Richelia intracellularis HH01]|uniref:Uncharacterized protein n=1 Tax=Richelia intracellularis HH01 TaxID=1165094 RepID=M1X2E2_9NOST|nr:hypothetical protein RINTHH_5150 [Richelia intracellularis HH01]
MENKIYINPNVIRHKALFYIKNCRASHQKLFLGLPYLKPETFYFA